MIINHIKVIALQKAKSIPFTHNLLHCMVFWGLQKHPIRFVFGRLQGYTQFKLSCVLVCFRSMSIMVVSFASLRPRQNDGHWAENIFKCIFLNQNYRILNQISLQFVTCGTTDNDLILVQITAWQRTCDKPLSEPMVSKYKQKIAGERYCECTLWAILQAVTSWEGGGGGGGVCI